MQKKAGFTLIELVLVIIILSIIAAMSSVPLMQAFTSYTANRSINLLDWQANVAMERMTREIRSIGNSVSIISMNPIQFIDGNNNTIIYSIIGGNLVETNSGVQNVLAGNATTLTIQHFNRNGGGSPNIQNTRFVKIILTIAAAGGPYTYQTSVWLHNLP